VPSFTASHMLMRLAVYCQLIPSPVFLSVTCVCVSFRVSSSVTDIACQIVCTLTVQFIEPLYGHGHEYLAATVVLYNLML